MRHNFRHCYGPRSARRFLFQCGTCCSKVWYPNVNSFSDWNRIMLAKFEPNSKCSLSSNHRTTITNILLYNKRTMLTAPCHCDYSKWHVYHYRSIPPSPLIPTTTHTAPSPNMGGLFAGPCTNSAVFLLIYTTRYCTNSAVFLLIYKTISTDFIGQLWTTGYVLLRYIFRNFFFMKVIFYQMEG
jgi:hypothetical protein